ncbi:MAG TPA: glycosyltransferase family 4 protein [Accumulibacter sp.]|nr:glycosyltransferase family 4 protein [Accumulibacter sp.]
MLSIPMRVLMLSPQYRPLVGGYERAAERLSAALVTRGHRVTVIAERRDPTWPALETLDGVTLRRLWCAFKPRLHLLTSLPRFAIFLLIRGRSFDVWHVHQYGLHSALAVALGKLLGRPVVLKLTSSGDQGLARTAAKGGFAAISSALMRRVSAVVALTRETKWEAQAFGIPAERVHQLGNGVDTGLFHRYGDNERAQLMNKLGIGGGGVVVAVGRLSKEKNPDGLLQAWAIAKQELSADWRLVVVGDGPMRAELEATVRTQGLGDSVRFVGQQNNIDQWIGAADIYVSSSHREGLSNTLLEAMAGGLPVVATCVSGVNELVKESGAGLVVDVGDMPRLAEALVRLAGNAKLRDAMGAAGRALIEERYSIGSVAASHEALYASLIGVRPGAGS